MRASFDVAVQEAPVEVIADGVIDHGLLRLGLAARLVLEYHVVVPPPLHLAWRTRIGASSDACHKALP